MGCASSKRQRPKSDPVRAPRIQQKKPSLQRTFIQQDQDLEREIDNSGISSKGHTSHYIKSSQLPKRTRKLGMFVVQDPQQGDQMLAIKPWQGALRPPTHPPTINKNQPTIQLEAQYVYGYRCFDSRQNIFYTNNPNEIVYMTAGVGIVLNTTNNTQKIYGAGPAKEAPGHDDDITALALHPGRQIVATGEVGKNPKICVWNVNDTKNSLIEFRQGRDTRAVTTLSFNYTGELLAGADLHNDHNVRIWTWQNGNCIFQDKGGPERILDISWAVNENMFCTVGIKHIYFWTQIGKRFTKKRGNVGIANAGSTFTCVEWKQDRTAVVGSITGQLLTFKGNSMISSYDIHGKNQAIHSLRIVDDIVYSGGKDNTVKKLNGQFKVLETYNVGAFPRAIDAYQDRIVIGVRDGSILEYQNGNQKSLMRSHCDGEVWGLALAPDNPNIFVTVGDDNFLIVWNSQKRKCIKKQVLQGNPGPSRRPGQGASTLASNTPKQQARAICINPVNHHIAIGHNDGHVTILESYTTLKPIKQMKDAAQWIECMAFSPDGSKLAIGSHDNRIYIYTSPNYTRLRTLIGHSSFIIALDWSQDSEILHSNCGAYELLFWNANTGEQIRSGATAYRDQVWATWTAKIGWPVQGIYEGVIDMTHVNTVDRSPDKQFFVIGNDFGDVVLFNNPNGEKSRGRGYKGHSEHVTNVKWGRSCLISAGGYDQTLIQWRVK